MNLMRFSHAKLGFFLEFCELIKLATVGEAVNLDVDVGVVDDTADAVVTDVCGMTTVSSTMFLDFLVLCINGIEIDFVGTKGSVVYDCFEYTHLEQAQAPMKPKIPIWIVVQEMIPTKINQSKHRKAVSSPVQEILYCCIAWTDYLLDDGCLWNLWHFVRRSEKMVTVFLFSSLLTYYFPHTAPIPTVGNNGQTRRGRQIRLPAKFQTVENLYGNVVVVDV